MSKLEFNQTSTPEDILNLYNHNSKAFSQDLDESWSIEGLKEQIKDGWKLYSVVLESEIVAAVFVKIENDRLLSKNTPIKMTFQGKGISHEIKDFFEEMAEKNNLGKVINYCRMDNFRGISLNESHGYHKTGNNVGVGNVYVEWEKTIKS